MRRANLIAGSIFFLISVLVLILALQLPPKITGAGLGPGVVPIYLAKTLGVLAVILILRNIGHDPDEQEVQITKQELTGLTVIFLLQTIYLFCISFVGFGFATCLFVAILSNYLGKYSWWKCILLGLVFAVLSVEIFNNLLGLALPSFTLF